ncbi:MAG: TIGR02391 family protein [Flavobacteriales bacterium]|nr:TIGR02391 family protein [Flavobacteriales bacterium]
MKVIRETNTKTILECAFCSGNGKWPDTDLYEQHSIAPCPVCFGRGVIVEVTQSDNIFDCALCDGTGKQSEDDCLFHGKTCSNCNGKGIYRIDADGFDNSIYSILHPKVREIIESRFAVGHFADGIESALKEINVVVKAIVINSTGLELDGANLMNKAFSPQNPIIKLTPMLTHSERDEQTGYMQIFAGSMTGIRNPKAHGNIEIDYKRAMNLASLCSLLMYKIDERIQ